LQSSDKNTPSQSPAVNPVEAPIAVKKCKKKIAGCFYSNLDPQLTIFLSDSNRDCKLNLQLLFYVNKSTISRNVMLLKTLNMSQEATKELIGKSAKFFSIVVQSGKNHSSKN